MADVSICIHGFCPEASVIAGWGAVLSAGQRTKDLTGAAEEASPDRIALIACIESIRHLKMPCTVHLLTNSAFVVEGMSLHLDFWKQNRWRDTNGNPIGHEDLWRQLDEACAPHDTIWGVIDASSEMGERVASLAHEGHAQALAFLPTHEPVEQVVSPDVEPIHGCLPSGRMVVAYTDGSCLGTPGPGGWAVIMQGSGITTQLSGGEESTTNNRMELMAAIQALESTSAEIVRLVTDSRYVMNGVNTWMAGWKNNGWRNQNNKGIKNGDLWRRIDMALKGKTVTIEWVKGHSGDELNEQADKLAKLEARKIQACKREVVVSEVD